MVCTDRSHHYVSKSFMGKERKANDLRVKALIRIACDLLICT